MALKAPFVTLTRHCKYQIGAILATGICHYQADGLHSMVFCTTAVVAHIPLVALVSATTNNNQKPSEHRRTFLITSVIKAIS